MGLVRSQSHVQASEKLGSLAPCQSLFGPINCVVSWAMTTRLMLTRHCSQNKASQDEWLRNWKRHTTQNEYLTDGAHQYLPPHYHHGSKHLWCYLPRISLRTPCSLSCLSSLKALPYEGSTIIP